MTLKAGSLLILTFLVLSVLAVTAPAKTRIKNTQVEKLSHYGFLLNQKALKIEGEEPRSVKNAPVQSLGVADDGNSPGALVAHTWYEYQHNSTMGRQIDWRGPKPLIHMAYTQMLGSAAGVRLLSYNVYDPVSGTWPKSPDVGCNITPSVNARSGFANIDADPSGAAVVTGHVRLSSYAGDPTRTTVYWDATAPSGVFCGFGGGSRIPDSLNDAYTVESGTNVIFPKLEYQIWGSDTVAYAFACEFALGDRYALVLFRKEGNSTGSPGDWTATYIDDAWWMCQDITASRVSPEVAVVWLKDAAEGILGQSDVWYWVSRDMGKTWNPADKHNITDYEPDLPGYRAWMELSCLYDTQDNLHVIWNGNIYDGNRTDAQTRSGRLFHWADHTDRISTVKNAEWDAALNCGTGGVNVHNLARFAISECNGRLYVTWVQFGDPENGDSTDCSEPGFVGFESGANGDIYLSVSVNLNGDRWDEARNLTRTKTPGCDDTEGNECDNENWPSMSRYGMDNTVWSDLDFNAVADALMVDPSRAPDSPYIGSYYLDVLYVNDLVPGSSVGGDSPTPAANVPVKWFRLPCVEPVVEAKIVLSPQEIAYPEYTPHGQAAPYRIVVENIGNADLNITTVGTVKETLPGEDWLGVSATAMYLPAEDKSVDTLTVNLNKNGIIDAPGTAVRLAGRVFFEWQRQTVLDTAHIDIDFLVADTVVGIVWDTVATGLLSLVVSSNGNMGHSSAREVNFDFYNTSLECDNRTPDYIPGEAAVYLGNASPVILTADISGADTAVTASWAIFRETLDESGVFKPVDGVTALGVELTRPARFYDGVVGYNAVHTGSFVTSDSTLVMEKTYYAPVSNVAFIVQMMRIFSFDGESHGGLVIGEAYDWDIPSDSASYNRTGTDPVNDLVFIQGGEWDEPLGDSLECQDNDERFGGAVRAGYYTRSERNANPDVFHSDPIWGSYAEINEDFVYPANGFVPLELYRNMLHNQALNAQASSLVMDQHIVLTHFDNYTLNAADTLIIWTVIGAVQNAGSSGVNALGTILNEGKLWLNNNIYDLKVEFTGCCKGVTGDANCSGGDPDIADITRLIDYLYLSNTELCCPEEADANGSRGTPDISDITKLIDYLYLSHAALPPCP